MRNKTIISVILLALIIPTELLADAFPRIPESLGAGGPAISLELPGSFEREFNNGHSLLAWGSMATLLSTLTFGYRFVIEKKIHAGGRR